MLFVNSTTKFIFCWIYNENLLKNWGNYKKGSDIDLALVGENVDRKIERSLSDELNEEYPLPYFFDVVSYKDISNDELIKHIDNVGKYNI